MGSTAVAGREVEAKASYVIAEGASLTDIVDGLDRTSPEFVAFRRPVDGGWADVTAAEFAAQVRAIAKGLIASGVQAGDRVALMSATRYEWTLIDYAIWTAGACTVAIYDSSATDQARWILEDSGTKLLIVENERHAVTVAEIETPDLVETLRLDEDAVESLISRGLAVADSVLAERRAEVGAATPATLIYTSGTTGRPKGVVLTHENLLAESLSGKLALRHLLAEGKTTLMFLPLAHVFARAIAVGSLAAKVTVAHSSDWTTLTTQFASYKPDFILAVPRVFEKVYNGAKQQAHDSGKGKIFDLAADTAIAWSAAQQSGGAGLLLRAKHAVFDKLVYSKLRAALGGRCSGAVSGGGPLGARLGHFFRGIGVPVFEGYGLTETSAAITVNTVSHMRVGTVGLPLEGNAVRIAEDGEVLLKGNVVFNGYWKNEAANAEALTDGWFHTGDLGALDTDGYLSITGRKKEIIVTAAGKNVSPAPMEDTLRAHPLIGQCMIVGDNKPFVGVLITLDRDALPGWRDRNNIPADVSIEDLVTNPALVAEIDAAVAESNKKVSKAESVKRTRILAADWTQETGELTPKLSLKRAVVLEKYATEVAAIYS
ncbi:long-chain fatty acid--CoA ligase [Nocardia sp. NBC_01503]|uniref:AMP-dependent synthetase/ligase n=1 Tax=Nocardia sp. NBC_01503 TaxID=2975997 RepID=UPI002E7B8EBA|nr:long-chain fatty acid--CoA ligase [Nocardia sp. NBC_01503]WTL33518.1 long-chain fatty acid--CoA ligase [Nocardia sp. NBC_01503]